MSSALIEACRRRDVEHTPVWFMRQAGRYLPSYRKIREGRGILEIARDPELASSVTVDPVRQLGVDAAVLFADIMLPMEGIGVQFRIEDNVGPVISNPIAGPADVERLGDFEPEEHVGYVLETVRRAVQKLGDVPLVGFSGAPFTLASYLIEGSPSRDFQKTKKLMYGHPEAWEALMRRLTDLVKKYLRAQARNGASALQLFDSWVGCLSASDYEAYVSPYTREIFVSLSGSVPTIHFCANSAALVESFAATGCDVLSVDWRVPLDEVWKRSGEEKAVQGNLDPSAAAAGGEVMERRVGEILARARGHRGHIFNLGHGVLRETPPENLKRIVQVVHDGGRGGYS
jgi:uroporphyrinogen decarboxylase